MKYISYILILGTLCLTSFAPANGQKLSDSESKKFLAAASEKTSEYSNVFKNLTVEEIKTFETFDKDGNVKSRKKILSDLIVYEPEAGGGKLGEFRNVREVDGEKIKNSEKRTVKIFSELANAKSFEEELRKLNKESSRYDENLSIYGFTLGQYVPLASNIISSFKFEETRRENIEGKEALVIKFQQTSVNPDINLKINAPDFFEISHTFYRGTIWLDLKNHRILKLVTELTAESAKFAEPFVTLRQEYHYQPSDFEIYTPRKIVSENFTPQADKDLKLLLKTGKAKLFPQLQTRLSMEYKNFSKFDVTVKPN
ncbi:MAG TPA: hypothetical protein VF556_10880 [Pyrinomonadaceae bacterium]|jgi:hypothetical protein